MNTLKVPRLGKFARSFLWLVLVLGLLAIVYSLWVPDYVRSAFAASEQGKPVVGFIDHTRHDLDYYLQRADLIFWQYLFLGLPLTLLAWYLFLRVGRLLIRRSHHSVTGAVPVGLIRSDTWIALGCYIGLTTVYFYPCLQQFNTALVGPPGDNLAGMWSLWWAYDQSWLSGHSLTFSDYIYYPEGSSLYYFAWSFYNLGVAFLSRQFFNVTAAFNVVILHGYPIAGLGAFIFVRRLTGNSLAAIVSGFLFAFSPNHFARSPHHIHINSIQFIPFFVMYFIDCIRDRTKMSLLLAALFFLLNALCDWTYMIMAGYFMFFGYVYLAVKARRVWLGDYVLRSAIVVAATLALLSPWLLRMIQIGLTNPEVDVGGRNTYVVDLLGLFVPGVYHWLGKLPLIEHINASYTGNATEGTAYLGVAAIVTMIVAWRAVSDRVAKYLLGAGTFLVLSLGPQIHVLGKSLPLALPYTILAYVPFLSNVRAPARFMVYACLFWSIIVGIALSYLFARWRSGWSRTAAIVAIVVLLFADYFSVCSDTSPVSAPASLVQLGQANPGAAILNLPLGYVLTTRYMMEQTIHGLKIVQGAATRKIGKSLEDRLSLDDLELQRQQLTDAKVKYIVVRTKYPEMRSLDLKTYRANYELVSEENDCIIFRVY